MEGYKGRLYDEILSLEERIHNLENFVNDTVLFKTLSWKLRIATRLQLFFMRRYYFWLANRVNMILTKEDFEYYSTPVAQVDEPVTEVKETKKKKKRNNKKTKTNE